jgi:ABC-2 type transport system ATP-binding protein
MPAKSINPINENDVSISVKNVSKDFKLPHQKITTIQSLFVSPFKRRSIETQHALKDVSFDIKNGEFFGIIGRNGCGKSTLLKMIAGIYQPTKGSVTVNGTISPFLELGVGFNGELTGRENVFLNGALLGFSKKKMLAVYDEIVDFSELGDFMDQKLMNYSSGMQVRLAFAVAIQAQADILLLDEVLAVGDANFQEKCLEQFNQFKLEGKTIVFVTHSMGNVNKFCDRVVLIDSGKIDFIGGPTGAIKRYNRLNGVKENTMQ